jgi:hypothetical protein
MIAGEADGVNWDEILALLNEAHLRRRGYADYWDWPLDKRRAELGVVRKLASFLADREGLALHRIELIKDDPPDVLLETIEGQRIAVEVTELVSEEAAQLHRHRVKTGEGDPYAHAIWTANSLAAKLSKMIATKEDKLARRAESFDSIILAIVTDEPMITVDLAEKTLGICKPSLTQIDRSFLLLGYIGEGASASFPDGYPVLEIGR